MVSMFKSCKGSEISHTFFTPYLLFKVYFPEILNTVLLMIFPLITKYLIDDVYAKRDVKGLLSVFLLNGLLLLIAFGAGIFSTYLKNRVKNTSIREIKSHLFCKIIDINNQSLDNYDTLLNVMSNDIDVIVNYRIDRFTFYFTTIIQILFASYFLISSNFLLTFLYLLMTPLTFIFTLIKNKKIKNVLDSQKRNEDIQNNEIKILSSAISQIKLNQLEPYHIQRWNTLLEKKFTIRELINRYDVQFGVLQKFLNSGWELFVTFYGWFLVLTNIISIGTLIMLQIYIKYVSNPIFLSLNYLERKNIYSISLRRYCDILNSIKLKVAEDSCIFDFVKLRIEQLSFKYLENMNFIFDNLSLIINKGDKILLKGKTGSGKTTLINIITDLETNYSGSIYMNNFNYRDLHTLRIRSFFSVVSQKPFIYPGSVYLNIFIDKQYKPEMLLALDTACIDDMLDNSSDLLNDLKKIDSTSLSFGQCQQVALARALVRNTQILILDEVTNGMDQALSEKIMDNIFLNYSTKTIIFISHNNNISRGFFDKIIEL